MFCVYPVLTIRTRPAVIVLSCHDAAASGTKNKQGADSPKIGSYQLI
jgi:hypothetical protein